MDKVTIVIEVSQQEGAEPMDPGGLVKSAVKSLEGGGLVVHRSMGIGAQQADHPAIEAAIPKLDPAAKPAIPYQSKATLTVNPALGGNYMDVVGDDGNVLASFEKPDVRRAWQEMNR